MKVHGSLIIRLQAGQALVEHLYLWPLFVLLVLGTIQFCLFYRDKAVVNEATFQAAREGALSHAYLGSMRKRFVESLVPLYMSGNPDNAAGFAVARTEAFLKNGITPVGAVARGSVLSSVMIEVISPNQSVFDNFSERMYALEDNCQSGRQIVRQGISYSPCTNREREYFQIPSDNLHSRDNTTKQVSTAFGDVEINIQDANLLKIKGHWCSPMRVPVAGGIIYHTSALLAGQGWDLSWIDYYATRPYAIGNRHPLWASCSAKNLTNSILASAGFAWRTYYLPISSDSVLRMQTPVRCEGPGRLRRRACVNLN